MQIRLRLGLTLQGIGGEFLGSVGEVAAADHRVHPQISQQVGDPVSEYEAPPAPAFEREEEQVVFAAWRAILRSRARVPAEYSGSVPSHSCSECRLCSAIPHSKMSANNRCGGGCSSLLGQNPRTARFLEVPAARLTLFTARPRCRYRGGVA